MTVNARSETSMPVTRKIESQNSVKRFVVAIMRNKKSKHFYEKLLRQ